ncbi:beta-lactamase domain-containing protein 2-like [Patiria miniata]|uniref:Beta-lactamase-related domain-containing protein n=1 Tax=Patiria miniata TaxID=46514 RepID=A0A914BTG9_PATMI|nr:beta-lactamase domain-containing protein 2-like [Patiria miniata]
MAFMKSAILVCVTAVLTVYLPQLWTKTRPIITAGTVQPGFEPVAELFRENFKNGVEYPTAGSALSVYYKGSKVVDIWGGYADSEAGRPWKEDTLTIAFSATKGMAALCMAVLVDRGHLDYNKTVASYWPEFAQNGKEKVTVRMLLNHQAGLSEISDEDTYALLGDQDALGDFLARYAPEWEPGTAQKYHAWSFGLYASQLLRRADPKHRTLGQFFKEEIAQPFGIDFHIGFPLELYHRYPRLSWASAFMWLKETISNPTMRQFVWNRLIAGELGAAFKPIEFQEFMIPEKLALEQPSACGVGTARALAQVYGILANGGATLKGQKLLSEGILKKVMDEARTPDGVAATGVTFNLGFLVEMGAKRFGHPGAGGQYGVADPQHRIGIGYVSSYISTAGSGGYDDRFDPLREVTYKCITKLEAK